MPILSNPRHERFAQELAKGKSATEAYAVAGYEGGRKNAARLATNDDIQARVEELLSAGAARAEITVERVLRELGRVGFADIRKAVAWRSMASEAGEDENGEPILRVANEVELIGSDQIDDETAAAIAEVSQTKDGLKIKFHPKIPALVEIGRHLGVASKHEHTGKDGAPLVPVMNVTIGSPER